MKIVSEHDQEIPQSQTADNPVAPRGRAAQPSRDSPATCTFSQKQSQMIFYVFFFQISKIAFLGIMIPLGISTAI